MTFGGHLIFLVDCTPGYFGPNCSIPCRYPGYGSWCQKECNCNVTVCSHVNGCPEYNLDGTNLNYDNLKNVKEKKPISTPTLSIVLTL